MTGEQKPGGLEGDASGVERGESAGDMLSRLGMDGKLWAEEFQKTALTLGYPEMDDGWLLGWFCNAIMAGYDHARRKYDPEILAHFRPQPSGETREAVLRLEKDVATVKSFSANIATFYGGPDKRYIGDVAADIETVLALIRPAPVASSDQPEQGGGMEVATWHPLDDNGTAEVRVNGKRITSMPSYGGAEDIAARINAALTPAEPAEARVRSMTEERDSWRRVAERIQARATAAEAKLARAVEGLEAIRDLGSDGEHSGDRHARCRDFARQALAALQEAGEVG